MSTVGQKILTHFPRPIAACMERLLRVRNMEECRDHVRNLFEVTIKYCADIGVAHHIGARAREATVSFDGLSRPSMGHWLQLLRLTITDATEPPIVKGLASALSGKSTEHLAMAEATRAIRSYLNANYRKAPTAVSPFEFADAMIAYRNQTVGHGAPNRRHNEEFTPILQQGVIEFVDALSVVAKAPLAYLSEITVDRRRFVHQLLGLTGTVQVSLPSFVAEQERAFAGFARHLCLLDPNTNEPRLSLHPLVVYAREEVYLLHSSDLDHTIQYICHHTGDHYQADHFFEDFRSMIGPFLRGDAGRHGELALEAESLYRSAAALSLLDGVVNPEERAHLEEMRRQLQMTPDQTEAIEATVVSQRPPVGQSGADSKPEGRSVAPTPSVRSDAPTADSILSRQGLNIVSWFTGRSEPSRPVRIAELTADLARAEPELFGDMTPPQLVRLIADLRNHGLAGGVQKVAGGYALIEEHMSSRRQRARGPKHSIAAYAASLVQSGMSIAFDGGSTTLLIAERIVEALDAEAVTDLKVITNSIPAASVFAEFLERRGFSEDEPPVQVYLAGGRVRSTTSALADPDERCPVTTTSLTALLAAFGPVDLAFVGCNGLTARDGVTVPTADELGIKQLMLSKARSGILVGDSTKLGVRHAVCICEWTDPFTLLMDSAGVQHPEFTAIAAIEPKLTVVVCPDQA